ncbi:MAG: hypothetical protein AAF311_17340, partial [Pseudomonadota bacterium]
MLRTVRAGLIATMALGLGACYGYGGTGVGVGVSAGYHDVHYGGHGAYGGGWDVYDDGFGYFGQVGWNNRFYDRRGFHRSLRFPAYYGWYDNFYYPGHGIHVFDRRGLRHRWQPRHRRYWDGRRAEFRRWRHRNPGVSLD